MRWVIAWLGAIALTGCDSLHEPQVARGGEEAAPVGEPAVTIVPRTPHLATYPCGLQCHDAREPDPQPRELVAFHAGREIDHGTAIGWCDSCHAIDEPDRLQLLRGDRVSFDASDRICAQCHGEKHRDWSNGIHGLQTGGWRGTVRRRLCTACHDPHAPEPIWFEALPPPLPDPRVRGGDG